MGTFERLSVLVIGVILVMILVVAVVTWTDDPIPCTLETAELDTPVPGPRVDPLPEPIGIVSNPGAKPNVEPWVEPPAPSPSPPPQPGPEAKPASPPAPKSTDQPTRPEPRVHVVQKGESLISIARAIYGPEKRYVEIMRANGLETPLIHPGQKLIIPPEEVFGVVNEPGKLHHQPEVPPTVGPVPGQPYTVRSGEDLPAIAKYAYDDVERWIEIWIANRQALPDPKVKLKAGTVLRIP